LSFSAVTPYDLFFRFELLPFFFFSSFRARSFRARSLSDFSSPFFSSFSAWVGFFKRVCPPGLLRQRVFPFFGTPPLGRVWPVFPSCRSSPCVFYPDLSFSAGISYAPDSLFSLRPSSRHPSFQRPLSCLQYEGCYGEGRSFFSAAVFFPPNGPLPLLSPPSFAFLSAL